MVTAAASAAGELVTHRVDRFFKVLDFGVDLVNLSLHGFVEIVGHALGFLLNLLEFSKLGLALDVAFDLLHHALGLAKPLAGRTGNRGQTLGSENHQRHRSDDNQLGKTEIKHCALPTKCG